MYVNKSMDIFKSIENLDVFNSNMLSNLRNIEKSVFIVKKKDQRPDLICMDIYGDNVETLTSLIVVLNKKTEFNVGDKVYYVKLEDLSRL